jgi:hypothetical protein
MTPDHQQRQPIVLWHLKLCAMIDESVPDNPSVAELEGLPYALLEMGISALLGRMDQTETMTVVNQTLYDLFEAQDEQDHWRHRENAEMAAIYKQVRQQLDQQRR